MGVVDKALPLDPHRLRDDFPILSTTVHGNRPLVYLDNAATAQRPRQVIRALVDMYERHYANVHRGIHWLSDQSTDLYEEARERVRQFIGAQKPHEIVFTAGTTSAINLVARSWGDANMREGDEVVLSVMEHHSNLVPWLQLADRTGCVLKYIPITDEGELIVDELDRLLTERTRMVAVTAVSNVLGTTNPLDQIIRKAHDAGALVLVDAAQSVPHSPTDVTALGADFLAFSGHKMLAPTGVGVLYGREGLLDAMPPFLGGGSMIRRVQLDGFEPADLPAKFEAGTPPIAAAIGLGKAIEYLAQIGLEAIGQYERILTQRAHEVLKAFGQVRLLGPAPHRKAGIVSFVVQGVHAHDVAHVMDRQGIAVRAGHHCTMPLHKRLGVSASTRASVYFYNTLEEVEKLGEGLTETLRIFRRRR
jgi:cysteine desulfurase/selenocysteine lyase